MSENSDGFFSPIKFDYAVPLQGNALIILQVILMTFILIHC